MDEVKVEQAAVKPKRVMTEKQRAGLQKGMEALKAKRELLSKQKEEKKEAKSVPVAPVVVPVVEPAPAPTNKVRKTRADKGMKREGTGTALKVTREEFDDLKTRLTTPSVVEKVVEKVVPVVSEKIVERVVEKEKVLSGSDLLNKIFFNR